MEALLSSFDGLDLTYQRDDAVSRLTNAVSTIQPLSLRSAFERYLRTVTEHTTKEELQNALRWIESKSKDGDMHL